MRGRKAGSVSFAEITLRELNAVFKEDAVIIVSVNFLKMNRLQGRPIQATKETYEASGEQPNITEVTE